MLRRLRRAFPVAIAVLVPLVFAGWTLTAVFAESPSPSASASEGSKLPGDPQKGQQVYGSSDCSSCHGANLEGGVGPKLNPIEKLPGVSNPLDPTYLITIVQKGKAGEGAYAGKSMPAHASLSEQNLKDLAAYIIQSNQQGPAGLSPVDLARSNVFWVAVSVSLLVMVTWLLSRYNMRWIARRAAGGGRRQG
jgi:mono/diheme cytochrome c family protein